MADSMSASPACCLHGDYGNFGVVAIFLFDDLANRVGVMVAIENQQFDVPGGERIGQPNGVGCPMAMCCVTRIA